MADEGDAPFMDADEDLPADEVMKEPVQKLSFKSAAKDEDFENEV